MLTVDDYGAIRRAKRDGKSIRQIARDFGLSRITVRKALFKPQPLQTPRARSAPQLGGFIPLIDQILRDDQNAPPKQRHTAAQIFRRLRDQHQYHGGYAQVQRYLLKHQRLTKETFIPLGHLPGRRLEADFGLIHVDFPDGRRPIPVLVAAWAYSNAPFALALPFQRVEAVLEGMVAAFEFFGAVPHEVWWDNPKTVATLILHGRERRLHPRYAALASHYVFDPRFCMPARGNEKPDAESTVKAVQRRFATPVPRVADLHEMNTFLRQRCEAERDRTVHSLFGPFLIRDRLVEDLAAATALPNHRFEPCVIHSAVAVDKYQTVAFDGNRYSVPRPFAFQLAMVQGYVDRVVIAARGQTIATHQRCLHKPTMILDPLHYLTTLGRKPGAWDHSAVFRDWKLPACFAAFRDDQLRRHGTVGGARRFVKVLQLLGEHPLTRVSQALEDCRREGVWSCDAVIQRTQTLAVLEREVATVGPARNQAGREPVEAPQVHVPLPDLNRFNQLLARSGSGSGSETEGIKEIDC